MEKDNTIYLKLILQAIDKTVLYTNKMSIEVFLKDSKTQSAVIMQLQVIGELSKKVGKEHKEGISVPWKNMIGLRDFISHEYFNLDLDNIWNTIKTDLKDLKKHIKSYLKEIQK